MSAKVVGPARPIAGPHCDEFKTGTVWARRAALRSPCVCRSVEGPPAVAVLANSGRDYHIGWGRAAVEEQARALARESVTASLRIDFSGGIGDSATSAGAPAEVLYSEVQCGDLRHAIDYVEKLDAGPIGLVRRCGSAYAAFPQRLKMRTFAMSSPSISCVLSRTHGKPSLKPCCRPIHHPAGPLRYVV